MAITSSDSTKEPRSFSIGPTKVQLVDFSILSGATSGTITADALSRIDHIMMGGSTVNFTAAPTFASNVATLAFTVPAETAASKAIQDLTYTAVANLGASGDNITVAYTQYTAAVAATASLAATTPIVLTSAAAGAARNGKTFTLVVNAAAPNPDDTVLVGFTGTSSAIVCTVTPNDGTNNLGTPVNLTTAHLVTLINSGSYGTVTLTDAGSLRALQTATGGDTTALAQGGEGDGVIGTFSGGANAIGAAGSEVVTVVGNAISIKLQNGVSTATQVKAAFDASAAAVALASCAISGTGSTAQTAPVTAAHLADGVTGGAYGTAMCIGI